MTLGHVTQRVLKSTDMEAACYTKPRLNQTPPYRLYFTDFARAALRAQQLSAQPDGKDAWHKAYNLNSSKP